jgi:hypothetical protein
MAGETVRVEGLNDLVRAFGRLDKDLRRGVQKELAASAEIVRADAAAGFMHVNARSAGGFRPRVRGATAVVQQRYSRTTGQRPDYGRHQMWYLLKALRDKEGEVVARLDLMLGRLGGEEGF